MEKPVSAVERIRNLIKSSKDDFSGLQRSLSVSDAVEWTTRHRLLGFNGETLRARIIYEIVRHFKPRAFVETGTYHAATTILANTFLGLPVYSCEVMFRKVVLAKLITRNMPQIEISWSSSVPFLEKVTKRLSKQRAIFYLDAHAGFASAQLPLIQELNTLLFLNEFVAVIDDFQVPNERSFGFDQYKGEVIGLELIEDFLKRSNIRRVYLPGYPPRLETGFTRGYCVFWKSTTMDAIMDSPTFPLNQLKPFSIDS
jgi:hypothetical protein